MLRQIGLAFCFTMLAIPAHAELPDEVLNKDYEACMNGQNDPQRAQYCNCIRDGMRNWDLDSYVAMALQQANANSPAQVPPKIEQLAKTCIAQVLH